MRIPSCQTQWGARWIRGEHTLGIWQEKCLGSLWGSTTRLPSLVRTETREPRTLFPSPSSSCPTRSSATLPCSALTLICWADVDCPAMEIGAPVRISLTLNIFDKACNASFTTPLRASIRLSVSSPGLFLSSPKGSRYLIGLLSTYLYRLITPS